MLISEDGTGRADAESYLSVAESISYHTDRGNVAWLGITTMVERERALRRATDYINQEYRGRWSGSRINDAQRLDWPRFGAYVDGIPVAADSVPEQLRQACAELALRAITGALSPDIQRRVKSETIGPMTTVYEDGAPAYTTYRAIDKMLSSLLRSSGGSANFRVVRA